jgi:hypothetical protein
MLFLLDGIFGGGGGGGLPATLGDLSTLLAAQLVTLRATSPGKDLTTLLIADLLRIKNAATTGGNDLNTQTAIDLS